MTSTERGSRQLRTVEWVHALFAEEGIDYWLFGGWAVDFHAGRVTRDHEDVDLAIWRTDRDRATALLRAHGWTHAPDPGEDGYTGFHRGDVRVELAFLARDSAGTVYTPLAEGRGEWPAGSFGADTAEVNGVRARVVGLASLLEDKSGPRHDPAVAAKDRRDLAVLAALDRPD